MRRRFDAYKNINYYCGGCFDLQPNAPTGRQPVVVMVVVVVVDVVMGQK